MSFSQRENFALTSVVRSLQVTNFGQNWPLEYKRLYTLWGYFNRIYDLLYAEGQEWQRIASFALDTRFAGVIEHRFYTTGAVRCLSSLPCVGDGRRGFEPQGHVRIAFRTLREIFRVPTSDVCGDVSLCNMRKKKGWQLCSNYSWPSRPKDVVELADAKFTLVGAVLTIAYQVRNNLFHGSKIQMKARDKMLAGLVADIVQVILEEIVIVLG